MIYFQTSTNAAVKLSFPPSPRPSRLIPLAVVCPLCPCGALEDAGLGITCEAIVNKFSRKILDRLSHKRGNFSPKNRVTPGFSRSRKISSLTSGIFVGANRCPGRDIDTWPTLPYQTNSRSESSGWTLPAAGWPAPWPNNASTSWPTTATRTTSRPCRMRPPEYPSASQPAWRDSWACSARSEPSWSAGRTQPATRSAVCWDTLQAGDPLLIDAGNCHFKDCSRRARGLAERDIRYLDLGMGFTVGGKDGSGGQVLMAGGPAAKTLPERPVPPGVNGLGERRWGTVCHDHLGPASSGHFVKMIHDGIEYGLSQLILETFDPAETRAGPE